MQGLLYENSPTILTRRFVCCKKRVAPAHKNPLTSAACPNPPDGLIPAKINRGRIGIDVRACRQMTELVDQRDGPRTFCVCFHQAATQGIDRVWCHENANRLAALIFDWNHYGDDQLMRSSGGLIHP